jgi:serine phosphatase RsbU (regulator of sigma subunit)/Tfp pilus assembly protein PilF
MASTLQILIEKYSNAKSDTARANLCIEISTVYKSISIDSSLYWLNKSLSHTNNCKKTISDSTLCYYRSLAHLEISKVYLSNNSNLDIAAHHADSAVNFVSSLILRNPPKQLRIKANSLLSSAYNTLGRINLNLGNLNKSIDYFSHALELFEAENNFEASAKMQNNLGVLHRRQSNYAKSLHCFQKALEYFTLKNDSVAIASVLTNIGSVSFDIGAFEHSLENYLKALTVFEKSGNELSLASTLQNIGGVMISTKNIKESIVYYNRALEIYRKLNNDRGIATSYLSLGISFKEQSILDSAYIYLSKSQEVYQQIGDKVGQADALKELGEVYLNQKKYRLAQRNLNQALLIAQEVDLNSVSTDVYYNLARIELYQGNFQTALEIANKALNDSKLYGLLSLQKDIYLVISTIYEKKENFESSLHYHKLYFTLYDSLYSKDRAHKFAEMETLYQLEQKQTAIAKLEKEKEIREKELKNAELQIVWQRINSYIMLGVLIFVSVILFLLYRQFRSKRFSNYVLKEQNKEILQKNEEITTQKEEIEKQRNELEYQKEQLKEKSEQLERFNWLLTDSIDYASSIQAALLPSKEIFTSYFDDQFIMLFPKDVVSGDFYWAYPKDDTIIVALADCTGHGVPGGFMSMLGISALTELMGRQVTEPSDILNNMRLLIIESLKQKGKIGEHQEGMDLAVIRYTKGSNYIEFSGANHPLWLIRKVNDSYVILEQKGDRMPISYHHKMYPFNSHRIKVQKGDQIYLFTDGLRHQLGGDNFNDKYGKDRFRDILIQNAHLPMEDQRSIIEDSFFRWVSGYDQLDDITIVGLKI